MSISFRFDTTKEFMYRSLTMTTPLFKSLSDEALRIEYAGYRQLAYNNANIAASGIVNRKKCASQMGKLMRNIEIIEAIARKRGISLVGGRPE